VRGRSSALAPVLGAALVLAVPAAAALLRSGHLGSLISVAAACTGTPQLGAFPAGSAKAPANVRVMLSRPQSAFATSPPDEGVTIREMPGGKTVASTVERFGPARVDLVPLAPLTPGVSYEVVWTLPQPIARFVVGAERDDTAPVLASVGTPQLKTWHANGPSCATQRFTEIAVDVTDASPVIIAIWESTSGDPVLTKPPLEYAVPVMGRIVIDGHAAIYDPTTRRDPSHPGRGTRYALMAIDAAGNRSEVVMWPGGKRLPAAAVTGTVVAQASPDAGASAPAQANADASVRADAVASPDAGAVEPVVTTAPKTGGCAGCTAAATRHGHGGAAAVVIAGLVWTAFSRRRSAAPRSR
jgi:hypothetical protein